MYIVKIVDSIDTLSCCQSSVKSAACLVRLMKNTTNTKHMTGLIDKAIAKANQYVNLTDMRSFSTQLILYLKTTSYFLTPQIKQSVNLCKKDCSIFPRLLGKTSYTCFFPQIFFHCGSKLLILSIYIRVLAVS